MVLQLLLLAMVCSSTIALLVSILNLFRKKPSLNLPPSPNGLPIIGHLHLLEPLIHRSFARLSSQHGPLIRLRLGSIPCVVVSTPDLAEEFLKKNELAFSSRIQGSAIKRLTYGDSSFSFAPYGPYWKFIKKIFTSELLSVSSMNQFRPMRNLELIGFIRELSEKAKSGESVNLTTELVKLTNNIISQMMLGSRCSGTASEADEARSLVREVTKIFGEFNVSDFIWLLRHTDLQGFKKRYEDTHRRYDALLEKIIGRHEKAREENGGKVKDGDLLDMLLDVAEDENAEEKLTRENIKGIVLDFFTAGTDTQAITVDWTMAELISNPKVMRKGREEIDNVVGKNRLVLEEDAQNLPYIRAIIKETFRLHSPIPMVIRKCVQDCTVNGYNIPSETLLFVNNWAMGRDSKIWESPMEFRPERFLQNGSEGPIDVKGRHFQLLPFGTGRRGCPGLALAMQHVVTVVAALIQCFDWEVVGESGGLDMNEQSGLTAPRVNDLVCVPVSRAHQIVF